MTRSRQESGVREIRLRRSRWRGLETDLHRHRASPRPYRADSGRRVNVMRAGRAGVKALAPPDD